jgi:hypothetical protein
MRTALPEGGQQGWATGDAFENHAAYLLPSAVGCAERSDGRGSLYDSDAMRRFAGLELGDDRIPDETTILNFRHFLDHHALP